MKSYVICTSHRSREKVYRLVGEQNTTEFYQFGKEYNLTEIPSQHFDEALQIKGVRKGKFDAKWLKCWKTEAR